LLLPKISVGAQCADLPYQIGDDKHEHAAQEGQDIEYIFHQLSGSMSILNLP
jgi:hypothetical protein